MLDFKRLNEVIRDSGITKSFIATHFGKQRSMLNNWEKEKSKPSDEEIQELATLLGVSVDYLEGKSDIKKRPAPKGQTLPAAQQELLNAIDGFSLSELRKVREYAEFVKSQRKK